MIHTAPYRVVDWAGSHPIDEIEGTEWFFVGRVTCLVAKNERARRGQAGKRVKTVSNGQTEPDQGLVEPGGDFARATAMAARGVRWVRAGGGTPHGWRGTPPPEGWHEPLGGRDHPP